MKEEIKKFIISNYMKTKSAQIGDNDSFLEKGIIDSIGVIELVSFIQAKYGIKISPVDIIPENFDTLNNLERYIARKKR